MIKIKAEKISYCGEKYKYYSSGTFKIIDEHLVLKLKVLTTVKNFREDISYHCFNYNNINAILITVSNGDQSKTPDRANDNFKFHEMNIEMKILKQGLNFKNNNKLIRTYVVHHECIDKDIDDIIKILQDDLKVLDYEILENLLKCNEKEYSYDSTRLEIEEIQSNCNDQYEKSTAKLAILKPKESGGGVITGE